MRRLADSLGSDAIARIASRFSGSSVEAKAISSVLPSGRATVASARSHNRRSAVEGDSSIGVSSVARTSEESCATICGVSKRRSPCAVVTSNCERSPATPVGASSICKAARTRPSESSVTT